MDPRLIMMSPQSPSHQEAMSPELKNESETYHCNSPNRGESPVLSAEECVTKQNQVSTVVLHGVPIVCLFIDGKERLCLAQISNTLLKDYSYNEIHNRRVALGITCVQCTPVQLEILRRAGAMPISSRRCGMISKREAERLVKSFLEEHAPPKLPENFAFCVKHSCGWGCKGQFVPARYNSSRAKCIKCTFCNLFFSPNKFIFHFHRMPDAKYRHPDAANFNSWRRHLFLDYDVNNDDLIHAWEDVKAMFNGGSRKRIGGPSSKRDADIDFVPFEKKPKFDLSPPHSSFSSSITQPPNHTYPFIGIPTSQSNMMLPFPNPTFPMLPSKEMIEQPKLNMTELWKTRPQTMYNPLSFWWAKSLGMYPFGNMGKPQLSNECPIKETPSRQTMDAGVDSRYSAFKPVGLLGTKVFGDYHKYPSIQDRKFNNNSMKERASDNHYSYGQSKVIENTNPEQNNEILKTENSARDMDRRDLNVNTVFKREYSTENFKNKSEMQRSIVNIEKTRVFSHDTDAEDEDVDEEGDVEITNDEEDSDNSQPMDKMAQGQSRLSDGWQNLNQSEHSVEQPKEHAQNNIYDMSKEELQRELVKMMQSRDQTRISTKL